MLGDGETEAKLMGLKRRVVTIAEQHGGTVEVDEEVDGVL